jgi:hypothetical protein
VGYGRGPIPEGFLPVFSTDTEEEAKSLIVLTCPMNGAGQYVARELVNEQTLENLYKFSDKLAAAWDIMKKRRTPSVVVSKNGSTTGRASGLKKR